MRPNRFIKKTAVITRSKMMQIIQTQSTQEALKILQSARENKWEIRVSDSGNLRVATCTDRFKSGLTALIHPDRKRTDWKRLQRLMMNFFMVCHHS